MVIQHNLSAMNARRQMGINNSSTSGNLEKLSSGYRINKAGDDAAGLAISEKMRGQIRGLDMAATNTENGIALIQTAEGGLHEIHAILQRMRELAVQSANGTYADDVDRENITKEVTALKGELNRISSSTHYNGINLLDGSLGGVRTTDTSSYGELDEFMNVFPDSLVLDPVNGKELWGKKLTMIVNDNTGNTSGTATHMLLVNDKIYLSYKDTNFTLMFYDADDDTITFDSNGKPSKAVMSLPNGWKEDANTYQRLAGVQTNMFVAEDGSTIDYSKAAYAYRDDSSHSLIFQIGANGSMDQRVGLYIENMSAGNLGGVDAIDAVYNKSGTISEIKVQPREAASVAIKAIDAAVNQVSGTRADLGALQNRLEHTVNNLGTTRENLQAAESSIRDVDMAKEMMEFTKNNIIVQASQSMLAQANQLPQGVLQLLR